MLEDIKARIALALEEMAGQPKDRHEAAERIREMLGQLRATGMPLPQDLVELEAQLENDPPVE